MRYIYNKYISGEENNEMAFGESSLNAEYGGINPVFDPSCMLRNGQSVPVQSMNYPYSYKDSTYLQMGNAMRQMDYYANNNWNPDSYKLEYHFETEKTHYYLCFEEQTVIAIKRKNLKKERNNLRGGISHIQIIKDKGISICRPIWFTRVEKFQREDKPGKHYFNVSFCTRGKYDLINGNVVIEKQDISKTLFCHQVKSEVVFQGQETLCNEYFRSEILQLANENIEVMIPSYPGWYFDEKFGWIFLSRCLYKNLKNEELPAGMNRRSVDVTDRSVNTVLEETESFIRSCWQLKLFFGVRAVSSLLFLFEKYKIEPQQIIAAIVSDQTQNRIITTILKTNDFVNTNTISLNLKESDIEKELKASNDGIAVIQGPLTAVESTDNKKQSFLLRDVITHANGSEDKTRYFIALVSRYLPQHIPVEFMLPVDCTDISKDIDLRKLRSLVLEFDAAFIEYIRKNINKVECIIKSAVEGYRTTSDAALSSERENIYIMLIAVGRLIKDCFNFELFDKEAFTCIKELFSKEYLAETDPDEIVRNEFISVTSSKIYEGMFSFMERNIANKNFRSGTDTLIVDKKKGFLSFEMSSLNKIAENMESVRNGSELSAALKRCGAMKCIDNGGRQITIPGGRPTFYSVYLSEFGEEVFAMTNSSENMKFFILPEEAPEGFIPLVWFKGRCAGIVANGEGLPNFHCNISGMSGLGKNRGTFRITESYLKLGAKVIFIDVKGSCSEKQLIDMDCNLNNYQSIKLKDEGIPFNIFDLTAFTGKNAKASYVMNIFTGAVPNLSTNQIDELSSYVYSMIDDDSMKFSFTGLFDKFPNKRHIALEKKLIPFYRIWNCYTPKDNRYRYNSCREFLESNDRITILSIVQASDPELRSVVYAMMASIYAHQVKDSGVPIMLVADEMQHYSDDSPFRQWVSEGRQYRINVWGITQEYLSRDNDTGKFMSNAAFSSFYGSTTDSSKRVINALGNRYTREEVENMERGDIISKGYFWDPVDERHKLVILKGRNENN